MSESIPKKEELSQDEIDQLTQHWDDLAEEMDWLESQAEKAKEKGDEATLQKIGRYLAQNEQWMQRILDKLDPSEEEAPEGSTVTTAQETTSESQQAQSKRYERRFENPDGTIVTISADTEEELREKIREQNEANREAFSRY